MRRLKFYKLLLLCSVYIYIVVWFLFGDFRLSLKSKTVSSTHSPNCSITNVYFILEHLSKSRINLYVIDPFLLDYLFIRQLPFQQLHRRLITFGISYDALQIILSVLSEKGLSFTTSTNFQNATIDHIFIEYNQQFVHLAVLHEAQSYFLVQKNTVPLPADLQLSYGDATRAIEPMPLASTNDELSLLYPQNVSHFLWLYNISEFLECDYALVDRMQKRYHIYQNSSQLNITLSPMKHITDILNKLEKHYWLAGGTLLGWYRHCGLIPFTQDVDLGLFAEEYDENIRNAFLGNPTVYLWAALGLVNDSLEFRLFTGSFTFDLFWAYREDDHRWCGYQLQRIKYRRSLPLLPKLCSCDLFGYRFSVPCSPVDYLNNEYGEHEWKNPLEKDYKWKNIKYHSVWDDLTWMYAVRLYTPTGELREDRYAIDWIADRFNYSLKKIPSFLNILPDEPITLPPAKTDNPHHS